MIYTKKPIYTVYAYISQNGRGRGSYLSPLNSQQLPLLLLSVDISSDNETHDVKERHPSLLWQKLLRNNQCNWTCDPADLHDWQEPLLNIMFNLVERTCSINVCEGCQHDNILERRNQQVGNEDLKDLGFGGGVIGEKTLEERDEEMTERSGDEGTVGCHFGDTRGQVSSVLWAIFGDDGGEELLEGHEGAGSEHFCAERIILKSLEVDLG